MGYRRLKKYWQNEGGLSVILACIMTLLMACTALVADLGVNYVTQSRLSAAADAAALAGATKFNEGAEQVKAVALTVAAQNGVEAGQVEVEVAADGKEVTVTAFGLYVYFLPNCSHTLQKKWRKKHGLQQHVRQPCISLSRWG